MNVLCSAAKNNFWLDAFKQLGRRSLNPVYWVGSNKALRRDPGCFFHDVWKAFSLEGGIAGWDDEADSLGEAWITKTEYYNYLKILDRVDGDGSFSFSERDNLLKRQLAYWSFVLEKFEVDLVFFSNTPHLPHDYPLYLCAKRKGIKTLMFNVSSIPRWCYLTHSVGGEALFSGFLDRHSELFDELYSQAVEKFIYAKHELPWYMKAQKKRDDSVLRSLESNRYTSVPYHVIRAALKILALRPILSPGSFEKNKYRTIKCYSGLYKTKDPGLLNIARLKIAHEHKKKGLRKEYSRFSALIDPENVGRYVYFPLHYQPELTTAPLGGEASDQFHVISELSRALPGDVRLIVKEHPSQYARVLYGAQGRYLGCWEAISHLSNVVLCDMSVSSISLVKQSDAVVTVTGTAGWEALVNQKASFHFGGAWYQSFPAARKLDFDNLRSQLAEGLECQSRDPIDRVHLYEYFGNYAINADIHGTFKNQGTQDVKRTVSYIERAIAATTSNEVRDEF